MAERYIDVPGGRLAVHDFGDGPPIVLLHADIVDSWAWEPLTPFLLAAGYRVVAFDRRGFGDSVTEDVAFSQREDTLAVIDALGFEQVVLVGNSMGGMITLETAVAEPGRFAALVTIGTSLPGYMVEPTPEEAAAFDEMDRLQGSGDIVAFTDLCVRLWVDGPDQPPERVPEDIRELVREMCASAYAPERVRGRAEQLDPSTASRVGRLTMPLLAISGALDVSDTRATDEHLATVAPNARAVVMPDVAHMIGLEAPEELGALITDFLAPLPRWG